MKRVLFFAMLLCSAIQLKAQSVVLLDSIHTLDQDGNVAVRALFSYNPQAQVSFAQYYLFNGNDWDNMAKEEYTYDISDRQTSYSYFKWQDNRWLQEARTEYLYDEVGHLKELTEFSPGIGETKTVYVYDGPESNHVISEQQFFYNGSNWDVMVKFDYAYNEEGLETSKNGYIFSDNSWLPTNRKENNYDQIGRLIQTLYSIWQEGGWANSNKVEYSYDSQDNNCEQVSYKFSNDQWQATVKDEYEYSESGKVINHTRSCMTEDLWENYSREEYTYDALGNKLTARSYMWQNGNWMFNDANNFFYNIQSSLSDLKSRPLHKVFRDGRILILAPDDHLYDILGRRVE